LGRRLAAYLLGMFCMSLGIALAVRSDLGISAVSSVAYLLSQISGYLWGVCSTAVYLVFVLTQILILRRSFPLKNLHKSFSPFSLEALS
jgi:uncharacterized membrane protein YczE